MTNHSRKYDPIVDDSKAITNCEHANCSGEEKTEGNSAAGRLDDC